MYATIINYLPEEITIKRINGRTKDLVPETVILGVFPARIEDVTINRTSKDGVEFIEPSKKVFIADEDRIVGVGDVVVFGEGDEREVTAVGSGTIVGDYRFIEITL
ncbi:MAG: hypothetical protein DRR06_16705 [Gammaproteobacteria bacterium]|nr:MAG: hypothetical protein DRR06_16705 [Gammaproteobacteria bacterium]